MPRSLSEGLLFFLPRRRASALSMVEDLAIASAASLDREVPPDYTAGTLCLVILQCGSLLSVSKQSKWQLREGLRFLTVCSETLLSVPDQSVSEMGEEASPKLSNRGALWLVKCVSWGHNRTNRGYSARRSLINPTGILQLLACQPWRNNLTLQ